MARQDDRTDVDDLFWNEGEPLEPWDAAGPGGGRMRSGGREPWATEGGQEDSGDSWTQFFAEPVREPYGGAAGTGEHVPYGGRRFEYGRDTSTAREYGQLYGRDQAGYGHRRNPFYAGDDTTPWWDTGGRQDEEDERPSFAGVGPRNYRRSDERIEEEVVQRLAEADWIDAGDVEVQVSDGVVTLEGQVESRAARRGAEDLVAEVFGVVDVINRLRARQGREPGRA